MLRVSRAKGPGGGWVGGDRGPAGGRREGLSGGAAQEALAARGSGILEVSADGQDAEHKLSYSRIDLFSLLAAQ